MGIDVGTSYTKGVIIDKYDNIMSSCCVETLGDPVNATKKIILKMKDDIDLYKYKVVSVGVTGFAKRLVGTFLDSQIIRNEIMAVSTSVLRIYPGVKSIIDIGGEDSKIILINNGRIVDVVMNTACSAGIGNFLFSVSKKMGIPLSNFSNLEDSNIHITSRCMIYAWSDLLNKLKMGYTREEIMAGVFKMISKNYVNGVCKGKNIKGPVIFVGGVSKNLNIVKYLEIELGKKIIVNKNSQLFGCIGIAVLARESKLEKEFNFDIKNGNIKTEMINCNNCNKECMVVNVYKNNDLIDTWGNKCDKFGEVKNV